MRGRSCIIGVNTCCWCGGSGGDCCCIVGVAGLVLSPAATCAAKCAAISLDPAAGGGVSCCKTTPSKPLQRSHHHILDMEPVQPQHVSLCKTNKPLTPAAGTLIHLAHCTAQDKWDFQIPKPHTSGGVSGALEAELTGGVLALL